VVCALGEGDAVRLKSPDQFARCRLPEVTSAQALADLEEVKAIGAEKSATRTEEQSEIARYWYESSPQGWNRIAREVAATQKLDIWESARLLALVNIAMADGFIGGFEAKYYYNYWRPATAIREAGDKEWINYLPTPPVPDYPSTHTVLGAAAAKVMERFFGTDYISFTMTSGAPYPGITRKFWSFSEAARENGASRVFAGIHFSTAVNAGYLQGSQMGFVFERPCVRWRWRRCRSRIVSLRVNRDALLVSTSLRTTKADNNVSQKYFLFAHRADCIMALAAAQPKGDDSRRQSELKILLVSAPG
jgi:hypothetical protein